MAMPIEWFVVTVVVGLGALAAIGLARGFQLASWAIVLGVVAWLLLGAAALLARAPAEEWARAAQHRHALYAIALAIEAAVAGGVLAAAGFREARGRAAVAAWLGCAFAGLLIALVR